MDYFDGEKIIAFSCGYNHSLVMTEKRRIFSWGTNEWGQLGHENTKQSIIPKLVNISGTKIKKICCGKEHSLLLSFDGFVYEFGKKYSEESQDIIAVPTIVNHTEEFIDIEANSLHEVSIAKAKSGKFLIWGRYYQSSIYSRKETSFESFYEIFPIVFHITYKTFDGDLHLEDKFICNGYFEIAFSEMERIGEGSFGSVHKVQCNYSKKLYAVKKIPFRLENEKDLLKEFNIYNRVVNLNHKCIVETYEAWIENNSNFSDGTKTYEKSLCFYILMELCEKTLEQFMDDIKNHLELKLFLSPIFYFIVSQLFVEILEGVNYLHTRNDPLIHRDLKPANILLKRDKRGNYVKIADFGLLAIHQFVKESHTGDKGTVKYMAPEVIHGTKYDTKADVYSLGVIMENLFDIDFNYDMKRL